MYWKKQKGDNSALDGQLYSANKIRFQQLKREMLRWINNYGDSIILNQRFFYSKFVKKRQQQKSRLKNTSF